MIAGHAVRGDKLFVQKRDDAIMAAPSDAPNNAYRR
jgi:hypothetical protein